MRRRFWFAVIAIVVWGFVFSVESYAQNESEIANLVKLWNGRAKEEEERVQEVKVFEGNVDKTPAEGMYKGFRVKPGDEVQCLLGANTAVRIGDKSRVWLNYDSTILVVPGGVRPSKGEIYLNKPDETEVFLENGVVIKPQGTEFYVKTGMESIVYVFGGSVNVNGFTLNKENPVLTIGADGTINPPMPKDGIPKDIESNLFRARLWRDEIRHLMAPFWAKPQYYGPAAALGAGVVGAVIYKILRDCDTTLRVTVSR